MNRQEFLNQYWRYYESLEKDFIETIRFVSIKENNFNTHSIEYSKLLQVICSEVEVVFKEIFDISGKAQTNINNYFDKVKLEHFELLNDKVEVIKYKHMTIIPLKDWQKSKPPFWWVGYNNIKHNRKERYEDANLKSVLYALSTLYLLNNYLLLKIVKFTKEIDIPDNDSDLFRLKWERRNLNIDTEMFSKLITNGADKYKTFP